ncbi:alpha-hydroxy-acid oxidizing protein [Streptomyces atrovirens]|uniref:alpha-hydroxy-acid oxidizing protein n=1 Tax=Streptomyces atrovirens TaxID=285556 RepID=UPI0031D69836
MDGGAQGHRRHRRKPRRPGTAAAAHRRRAGRARVEGAQPGPVRPGQAHVGVACHRHAGDPRPAGEPARLRTPRGRCGAESPRGRRGAARAARAADVPFAVSTLGSHRVEDVAATGATARFQPSCPRDRAKNHEPVARAEAHRRSGGDSALAVHTGAAFTPGLSWTSGTPVRRWTRAPTRWPRPSPPTGVVGSGGIRRAGREARTAPDTG